MSRLLQLDKAEDLKLSVPMIAMFEKQVLAREIDNPEPVGNHAVQALKVEMGGGIDEDQGNTSTNITKMIPIS